MNTTEVPGWTPADKKAMVGKLYQFYVEYFYQDQLRHLPTAAREPVRELAQDRARRRMQTLVCNDVVTCGDILRLLSESAQTRDAGHRANLLMSVFHLMLVLDMNDPQSWALKDVYVLWRKVMTGQDMASHEAVSPSPPSTPTPCQRKEWTAEEQACVDAFGQEGLLDAFEDEERMPHRNAEYVEYVRRELRHRQA